MSSPGCSRAIIKERKYLSDNSKANIRSVSAQKSTYGTPHVRAIFKRDFGVSLSKYMVHRFMKEEGLLLERFQTEGNSRSHTGKIFVDKSNKRWASDITSIKCWNGQMLRLAFLMDCCNRSIICWKAGLHIQGWDIELMVQDALFERFGENLPPKGQLQLFHKNGSEYFEKKSQKMDYSRLQYTSKFASIKWNMKHLMVLLKEITYLKIAWTIQWLFYRKYKNGQMNITILPPIKL